MREPAPLRILGSLAVLFSWTVHAQSVSEEDLLADVEQLRQEIATAESNAEHFEEGVTKTLLHRRLDVLQLSKALLDQRLMALRAGIPVETTLSVTQPDTDRLTEILADIQQAQEDLAAAESESATIAGGLAKALAETRVATARQILATLRLAYYRDRYGLHLEPAPQPCAGEADTDQGEKNTASETEETATIVEWSDPRYPDIDYTKLAFQALAQQNSTMSGWWGIRIGKADIDDSPMVQAFNVSATAGTALEPHLAMICREGETKLLFKSGELLVEEDGEYKVEIRIDSDPAKSASWNATTNGKSAGLFGKQAQTFLRELKSAETLYIRLTDGNDERHDAKFLLSGIHEALHTVADACNWSTLSKADIKSIQSKLRSLGHYRGTVDGSWGKGSLRALNAWQDANGIPKTKTLTDETAGKLIGE